MSLSDLFQFSENRETTHSWTLATHDPATSSPQDALAQDLADRIMRHQCCGCTHLYEAWRRGVDEEVAPTGTQRVALIEGFVAPLWGTPDEPESVPVDHIEALVAEMLWYFLCPEVSVEQVVEVHPPHFKPTDPGGDGLVIHLVAEEYLMFRLWEIKKFATRKPESSYSVSSTVSTAYGQLDANAVQYLARYTIIGQESCEVSALRDFYGRLAELWIEGSPQAALGVSVTTSLEHIPQRCFSTFGERFPAFVNPARLRAMLAAIGDFTDFSLKVRDYIWNGLWIPN